MAIFEVDFSDLEACKKIREKYGNSRLPFSGTNAEGEHVLISVNPDNITVQTFQRNGWMRTSTLWADGTIEEIYDR